MMTNIAIIGEAWGEEEEKQRSPFVGVSGWALTKMLEEAGIHRADCFLTNVFNLRPPGNKIEAFCGPKTARLLGYPALIKGKYVRAEFAPELERLADELVDCNPNLIVCLGNTALWALSGKTGVSKLRGTTLISTHCVEGFKLLATYHPAAVLRQWELRPVTVIDLIKARREAEYPEIRRPKREIWIEPSIEDLFEFERQHIRDSLSVDIETSGSQITCIGFAPTPWISLVIPFTDPRKKGGSYWSTITEEQQAWHFVKRILESDLKKELQNALFDVAVLWRSYGIGVRNVDEDSMLLHHALQPESLNSLGFLASVYCSEASWKQMRAKYTTLKKEE